MWVACNCLLNDATKQVKGQFCESICYFLGLPSVHLSQFFFFFSHFKHEAEVAPDVEVPPNGGHFLLRSLLTSGVEAPRITRAVK